MAERARPSVMATAARRIGAQERWSSSDDEGDGGEQIAGHHAEGCVGEPCAGDDQSKQRGGAIEGATPDGFLRIAIAQDEQQQQRDPEAAGEFAECGAFVGGEHGVAGEERGATGKGCGSIGKCWRARSACGETGGGEEGSHSDGELTLHPGEDQPNAAPSIHVSGG